MLLVMKWRSDLVARPILIFVSAYICFLISVAVEYRDLNYLRESAIYLLPRVVYLSIAISLLILFPAIYFLKGRQTYFLRVTYRTSDLLAVAMMFGLLLLFLFQPHSSTFGAADTYGELYHHGEITMHGFLSNLTTLGWYIFWAITYLTISVFLN
jgi:hypothetical protein